MGRERWLAASARSSPCRVALCPVPPIELIMNEPMERSSRDGFAPLARGSANISLSQLGLSVHQQRGTRRDLRAVLQRFGAAWDKAMAPLECPSLGHARAAGAYPRSAVSEYTFSKPPTSRHVLPLRRRP